MNYYYQGDDPRANKQTNPCCDNCKYRLDDWCSNAESSNYENTVYPDGICDDYARKVKGKCKKHDSKKP